MPGNEATRESAARAKHAGKVHLLQTSVIPSMGYSSLVVT
jgi:hypothetical protein